MLDKLLYAYESVCFCCCFFETGTVFLSSVKNKTFFFKKKSFQKTRTFFFCLLEINFEILSRKKLTAIGVEKPKLSGLEHLSGIAALVTGLTWCRPNLQISHNRHWEAGQISIRYCAVYPTSCALRRLAHHAVPSGRRRVHPDRNVTAARAGSAD